MIPKKNSKNTSWGKVADWYHDLLEEGKGTHQEEVILPNLIRAMDMKKGEIVLDLACGTGYFAREFAKSGAKIHACDISPELVSIAKENSPEEISFFVCAADNISAMAKDSIDKISIVLAIQNIENLNGVLNECSRILKPNGQLYIVMNHPAFRIPQKSSWAFDEKTNSQYRKIDGYMFEGKSFIEMHPGLRTKEQTISFHRPLQVYFKALRKNGFCVTSLEEWISKKKSQPGPRAAAENKARKEFPMFLLLEAVRGKK